jgi:hypothetical protein
VFNSREFKVKVVRLINSGVLGPLVLRSKCCTALIIYPF